MNASVAALQVETVSTLHSETMGLRPDACRLLDMIHAAPSKTELDNINELLWKQAWPSGSVNDAEADFLSRAILARRPARQERPTIVEVIETVNRAMRRRAVWIARRKPRHQDRERARTIRRTLGGSSALPDTIRHHYTEGERSVLCVIAGEVKRHGICDLSIDEIADRAGCRRTTVQNAIREAERERWHIKVKRRPVSGQKSLTNVITIVSEEWLTWIKRGPNASKVPTGGHPGFKTSGPLKNTDRSEGGVERDTAICGLGRAARGYPREGTARFRPPNQRRWA